MKNFLSKIVLVLILIPITVTSQTWSRMGADRWPVDPNNFMNSYWGGNGLRNIGNAHIASVWVDPADGNHVLIGTFGGGIYETFDGLSENLSNIHWEHKTKNLPVHHVGKIIKHNNVLYASSGFYLNASNLYYSNAKSPTNLYGLGVIKSNDGGATWQIGNMPDSGNGFGCTGFTKPSSTGVMYAISRYKVYKSTDFGNNWIDLNITFTQDGYANRIITSIASHPTNPDIVFVGTLRGVGNPSGDEKVFVSTQGGISWSGLGSFFNYSSISSYGTTDRQTSLYVNNNDLYISFGNGSYNTTVIKSSNNNWSQFSLVGNYYTTNSYSSINYAKAFNKNFLYGMTGLNELGTPNNTSLTFAKTHDDIRGIDFASANGFNYIFTGHDGGISRSKDGGATWQNIMGDLNIPLINSMGYYTDPLDRAFDIGCQDTGWYRNELTTPPTESFVTRAYEGGVYTSAHNKRIYFETDYSDNNGVTRSPIPGEPRSLVEDPLDFQLRYQTGYVNQFYVSNNNLFSPNYFPGFANSNYNVSNPGLNSPTNEHNIGVRSKIALNSNKNILFPIMYFMNYAGNDAVNPVTRHKVIFSRDRGLTWVDVGANIKNADVGLPDIINRPGAMLTCVTMDDYHPKRMWVVFAGGGLVNQKVYESKDYGTTWANISYNLSDVSSLGLPSNTPNNYPVNQIEYDENRDMLFIGTDYGLYYLDQNVSPNQWKVYGEGLPRSIITNIFIDDYYNEIVVGTAGSGIWSAPLDDCKDVLIMEDTSWRRGNWNICGDLRIKHNVTLRVDRTNITAKNIILEPGARIIWDGGTLNSTVNDNTQSFVITSRESLFSVNNVTINNFTVNNFEQGSLQTGDISLVNTELNNYNGSYYDHTTNAVIAMNNSNVNFYSDYYYKTHASTPNLINSNYYSSLENINMSGKGMIKVYDNDLYVENDALYDRITPLNEGRYWFESGNGLRVGNNVTASLVSGDVRTYSTVDFLSRNFISFENGTLLEGNVYARIDNTISSDLITPYSRFAATDSVFEFSEANINQAVYNDAVKKESDYRNRKINTSVSVDNKNIDLELYPNPVQDVLKYKFSDKSLTGTDFKLVNLTGKVLYAGKLSKENGEVNVSNFHENIFLFIYQVNGKTVSKKVIKRGLTDGSNDFYENTTNKKTK